MAIILLVVVIQTVMMMSDNDQPTTASTNPTPTGVTPPPANNPNNPLISTQPQMNMDQNAATGGAVASYDQTTMDFGSLSAGEKKQHTFNVTNTGTEALQYGDITADNGARVVDYTRTPIAPGGTGQITVELDATGQAGQINPMIHVNSNADPSHFHLTLSANVQ